MDLNVDPSFPRKYKSIPARSGPAEVESGASDEEADDPADAIVYNGKRHVFFSVKRVSLNTHTCT